MCVDPVTATMLAATAAQAAAKVGEGVMGYMAEKEAARAKENEAKIARLEGGWRDIELKREADRRRASNVAQMSASGLLVTSGSFESILKHNSDTLSRDLSNNRFNTNVRVSALKAAAKGHKRAAGFRLAGSLLSAAGTVAGGVSDSGVMSGGSQTAGQTMSSSSRQYANSRSMY